MILLTMAGSTSMSPRGSAPPGQHPDAGEPAHLLGYTGLADRMVAAVDELAVAMKAARDALGDSPYA